MIVRLSFDAEITEIRKILDAIESVDGFTSSPGQSKQFDVVAFVGELSPQGRKAVHALAARSDEDFLISRDQWQTYSGIANPDEFNGVLGGIGRAWAKISNKPNPFTSHGWDSETNDHIHGITDAELRSALLELPVSLK